MKDSPNLSRADAANYMRDKFGVKYSSNYLRILAWKGEGPRYRHIGRYAFYNPEDLDEWIADRTTPVLRRASEILLAK
jgi:hypothetical protein